MHTHFQCTTSLPLQTFSAHLSLICSSAEGIRRFTELVLPPDWSLCTECPFFFLKNFHSPPVPVSGVTSTGKHASQGSTSTLGISHHRPSLSGLDLPTEAPLCFQDWCVPSSPPGQGSPLHTTSCHRA